MLIIQVVVIFLYFKISTQRALVLESKLLCVDIIAHTISEEAKHNFGLFWFHVWFGYRNLLITSLTSIYMSNGSTESTVRLQLQDYAAKNFCFGCMENYSQLFKDN